jgi:hypothetical protein
VPETPEPVEGFDPDRELVPGSELCPEDDWPARVEELGVPTRGELAAGVVTDGGRGPLGAVTDGPGVLGTGAGGTETGGFVTGGTVTVGTVTGGFVTGGTVTVGTVTVGTVTVGVLTPDKVGVVNPIARPAMEPAATTPRMMARIVRMHPRCHSPMPSNLNYFAKSYQTGISRPARSLRESLLSQRITRIGGRSGARSRAR